MSAFRNSPLAGAVISLGVGLIRATRADRYAFEKLEVHSKAQAVSFAYKMHVV